MTGNGTTTVVGTAGITIVAPAALVGEAPADARAEVSRLLEDFRLAIESRDLERLRRTYPGMTRDQEDSWRNFFGNARDLSVTFTVLESEVSGNAASTRFRATYEFRTNSPQEETAVLTARFERTERGWQLTAIQ